MNKKALWKDIWREVWKTKSRFFSILALIMLGVAFFAGLKATGPNMLLTADQYYTDYNLTDDIVQSTYGLDETDEAALKEVPGVRRVEMQYTADLLLKQNKAVMRLYSYTEAQKINQYQVEAGRLPKKSGEVALDATKAMKKDFKIGDEITFVKNNGAKPNDTLKRNTYKVVGFVNTPMFIETSGRGTSSIGKGKTDAIAVVPKQDFNMPVYTQANLTFTNTSFEKAFSDAYNDAADTNKKQIEKVLDDQIDKRFAKVQKEAETKIALGEQKLRDGRAELAENQAKLNEAKQEIDSGFSTYEASKAKFDAQMVASTSELAAGREKLRIVQQNIKDAKAKISTGELESEQARAKLTATKSQLDASQVELGEKRKSLSMLYGQEFIAANQKLTTERTKLDAAEKKLATKQGELSEAKVKLAAFEKEYAAGVAELNSGDEKLRAGREAGERELNATLAKLNAGQIEYEANLAKFNTEKKKAESEMADAEQNLQIAKENLADIAKPKYYVLDRSSYPGYNEYYENTERLTSLSTAFPAFFFLIAALVCLTTMTRMVEEQRTFIGTYKALGYNNMDIMKKFLVYGSLASLVGTIMGLLIGFQLFPNVIFNAYGTMYEMPPIEITFYPSYSLIALIVALVCTTVTAFVACYAELKASAATLMRPKSPKKGKRILLERVTPIWKRMRFSDKVTARNIFRYKQRMLMTVIGVAGCTALILTGFGLRDSISDIATLQYGNIMKYDALVSRDTTATKTQNTEYEKLMENTNIAERKKAALHAMDAIQKGRNQSVNVTAFESTTDLADFIVLRDRKTHASLPLSNNGVVITEKLADLFDLQAGDTLVVRDANNDEHRMKVSGITENYAGHYAYMTKSYYTKIFHEEPKYNTDLLNLKDTSQKTENLFAEKLIDDGAALQVTYSNTISSLLTDTLNSLNVVMVVLIVSAAILAFIVLYNLTNINVSERIRELSTIKVLGFYPKEVTMYVYRENIILSMMGILGGFVLGFFLHQYVITTAEIDNMMFSPTIRWPSYLYSAILTLVFSTIVMLVMHMKLKRIDMIEALKSVE